METLSLFIVNVFLNISLFGVQNLPDFKMQMLAALKRVAPIVIGLKLVIEASYDDSFIVQRLQTI